MIDLTGKVALVTGASRGIGRACALRLAESGADVVVNYLNSQSAGLEVADAIRVMGRQVALVRADVSEAEDVVSMVEFINERFGQLDIVVNNVAAGGFRPALQATASQFQSVMQTNVMALLSLVRAALPLLQQSQGRAKVVSLSSHGARRALPDYGLIGASKAALESLSRHLALETGGSVNFNVVLAGMVDTDAIRSLPEAEELLNQASARMLAGGRRLTAAAVADAVLFLASPLSDLVQGQTLVVDGGLECVI